MPMDPFESEAEEGAGLKLVDRASRPRSTSARAGSERPSLGAPKSTTPGLPLSLFVVVVVVFLVLLAWQARLSRELEGQVAILESQLEHTNVQLDAHRARLAEIRVGFQEFSASLESLRAMVDSDPTEIPAEPADAAP